MSPVDQSFLFRLFLIDLFCLLALSLLTKALRIHNRGTVKNRAEMITQLSDYIKEGTLYKTHSIDLTIN